MLLKIAIGWDSVTIDHPNSKIRFGRTWYYSNGSTGDITTFFGSIQSVRVYNRVLTNEEITQNYNVDKTRFNIDDSSLQPEIQLAGSDVSVAHYGKLTNFQSKGTGKENLIWRIFYKDANNIYLISSVKQNNVEQVSLTSHLLETSNSISNLGKALNPLYTATANSWSMNLSKEQTVAYLLDSTIWDDYTDQSGKATWAIGGPPVEMYANSLKQTFPTLIDTVWAEPGYGYRYSGTIA